MLVGKGGGTVCVEGGVREYIFFIPTQVSFPSPPDVTLTHVKQREEGGKTVKIRKFNLFDNFPE